MMKSTKTNYLLLNVLINICNPSSLTYELFAVHFIESILFWNISRFYSCWPWNSNPSASEIETLNDLRDSILQSQQKLQKFLQDNAGTLDESTTKEFLSTNESANSCIRGYNKYFLDKSPRKSPTNSPSEQLSGVPYARRRSSISPELLATTTAEKSKAPPVPSLYPDLHKVETPGKYWKK